MFHWGEESMAFLTDALEGLAGLPQPAVLAVTGALTLAECTLGVGFLAPGESALLLASTTVTSVPRSYSASPAPGWRATALACPSVLSMRSPFCGGTPRS